MGRTLPSITQIFHMEEESLRRFRRALRRADQLALDELFDAAQKHLSAAAYAASSQPLEIFLIAMLLEEYKANKRLEAQIEAITGPGPPQLYMERTRALIELGWMEIDFRIPRNSFSLPVQQRRSQGQSGHGAPAPAWPRRS